MANKKPYIKKGKLFLDGINSSSMESSQSKNQNLETESLKVDDVIENYSVDNEEYQEILIDEEGKILEYLSKDGVRYISNLKSPKFKEEILNEIEIKKTGVVTVLNSDKIGIIGDSYTESSFAVANKSYISKLSLFSDYQFTNFALSGDIYAGRINAIRRKAPLYGSVPYDEQKVKYTMMCCYTNDIKYLSITEYLESLEAAIKVVEAIGSIPIICTEYHSTSNPQATRLGLENVAKRFGLKFWNIVQITDILNRGRIGGYEPFWGGSHAGTRTNALESDSYEFFLNELPVPQQSLKVFRARKDVYEDLDEYLFGNNYERAKLFTEISVGERRLRDNSDVDNCTSASTINYNSEYQSLMQKNPVSLKKVNLVSAILPCLGKDLTKLIFKIAHNSETLRVFVKNCFASPYPTPVRYSSFYITFTNEPQIGDKYLCEEDNTEYTVEGHIIDASNRYHLLCTPFVGSGFATTGTLTKVSGEGDSVLNYTYREMGINSESLTSDKGYHYVEILEEKGQFDLTSNIDGAVSVDKIDLLLVSDTDFNITDLKFEYQGENDKFKSLEKKIEFKTNSWNENEELLPANHFGEAGVLDTNYNLTPSITYEESQGANPAIIYPLGCSSKVDITDTNFIDITIPSNKIKSAQHKLVLELWCRYFPEIYSDGSGNQITETSFDYNEIIVDVNGQVSLKEKVNTHWKIIRFELPSLQNNNLRLKIYSNIDGIELTYLSLKYEN